MNTFITCQEKGDISNQLLSVNAKPKNIIDRSQRRIFYSMCMDKLPPKL